MLGRVAATVTLAVLAGIALSLRDLVLPAPRQVPLPLVDLVMVGWVQGLVAIGWVTAQLIDPPVGFFVAPAAVLVVVGVTIVATQLRYPTASLTGEAFEILIWVWMLVGLVGAVIGSRPAFRVRSRELAASIGLGLLVIAGAVGAVPYVLASS
jgi:lysylphosphatidylglycerol synthetase-like protein (DUF2156 family)